ncbi:MAG: cell division protein FtsZ [Candidatus Njordarchaeales archaeon]
MSDLDIILKQLEEIDEENVSGQQVDHSEEDDEDIERVIIKSLPKIKVIGVGGAGNNTVTNLMRVGAQGVTTIAVNTDARQLLVTKAHKKVLIGEKTCRGHGAGNDPKVGEQAAKESQEKLKKILRNTDLLFLTCGLGGGTGSGATPYIAQLAQEMGILTVTICTLPFMAEGEVKRKNASEALRKLIQFSNTIIVIPNDKLLQIAPKKTLLEAFRLADDILVKAVTGIADLIGPRPGLVNVDFADAKKVLSAGGTAVIGIGQADVSEGNRVRLALERALINPLLDVKLNTAKSALINITGGSDITLEEAESIVRQVSAILGNKGEVKWGVVLDDSMKGELRITIIMAGIELPYLDEKGEVIYPRILSTIFTNDTIRLLKEVGISSDKIFD